MRLTDIDGLAGVLSTTLLPVDRHCVRMKSAWLSFTPSELMRQDVGDLFFVGVGPSSITWKRKSRRSRTGSIWASPTRISCSRWRSSSSASSRSRSLVMSGMNSGSRRSLRP